jgi:quercetin dioxygenase-like cupin family protein
MTLQPEANQKSLDIILRQFESPDETREFPKGRFDTVTIGDTVLGRASYEPGWKWSVDVGPAIGEAYCSVEHLGLVLAGHATAAFQDGRVYDLTEGTIFYIPPEPHDSWVVGDQPYVSLHFLGAGSYAREARIDTND